MSVRVIKHPRLQPLEKYGTRLLPDGLRTLIFRFEYSQPLQKNGQH